MSEEIKANETKEEKCCCICKLCKSEEFKKFLVVALGTFVGFFCALSLFAALHKPPMIHQHHGHHFKPGHPRMERPMPYGHHFSPGPIMHNHFRPADNPYEWGLRKHPGMKNFEMPKPQIDTSQIDDKK